MWYSSVGTIPSGWHLCDGSTGTPDLRDKFIPCAGSSYNVGATGGVSTFSIYGTIGIGSTILTTAQIPAHTHDITDNYNERMYSGIYAHDGTTHLTRVEYAAADTGSTGGNAGHTHPASLSLDAVACLPPYYALCYIKKTS
jgi:microcystin-dependent protein